jgi:acyl transferase domain-containing protein
MAPDGRSKTFDAAANGTGWGEGGGLVLLKSLSRALEDRDVIHAVIKGGAVNQDGGRCSGLTAPSPLAQTEVIRAAWQAAEIDPSTISYIEAHGTGTKLGDPIEIEALTRAFRRDTDRKSYCAIGSIKTNIGHAVTAAGVAGVIKVLLGLRHKQIPPSINFDRANTHIDFQQSPFYVNTQLRDWEVPPGHKRCAAVSSFGFSGTIAHVVIEEFVPPSRVLEAQPAYLFVLSAKTPEQLRARARQLTAFIAEQPEAVAGDVSFTLLMGRAHLSYRLAIVATDLTDLRTALVRWLRGEAVAGTYVSKKISGPLEDSAQIEEGNRRVRMLVHRGPRPHYAEAMHAVARAFVAGCALDYVALFAQSPFRRVPLPTHPFAEEKFWVKGAQRRKLMAAPSAFDYRTLVDQVARGAVSIEDAVRESGLLASQDEAR